MRNALFSIFFNGVSSEKADLIGDPNTFAIVSNKYHQSLVAKYDTLALGCKVFPSRNFTRRYPRKTAL